MVVAELYHLLRSSGVIPGPAGGLRVDPRVTPPRELWRGGSTPPWHQHYGVPRSRSGPYARPGSPRLGSSSREGERSWPSRRTTTSTTTSTTASFLTLSSPLNGGTAGSDAVSSSMPWSSSSVDEWMPGSIPCSTLVDMLWCCLQFDFSALGTVTMSTTSTTTLASSATSMPPSSAAP